MHGRLRGLVRALGERPPGNIGFLVGQMVEGMGLAPLVLPAVFVQVSCLRACDAVEAGDSCTSQPGESTENSPLLLGDLGSLELIDHRVALADGGLRQVLRSVLAAERLQVSKGHRHVRLRGAAGTVRHRRRTLLFFLFFLVFGLGGLIFAVFRNEETVHGSIRQLGLGVGGLRKDGLDDVCTRLEGDLIELTLFALQRNGAHNLDLVRRRARRCCERGGELLLEVVGKRGIHLQLSLHHRDWSRSSRCYLGGRVQGVLQGLKPGHDRGL
mmetsp:Transcript_7764/g.11219  ORF Transcript_7764/g.11219 Transcript_7764/m.11219 type:complete len:270 (-) Transcript_7764:367-1176(-)